MRVGGQRLLEQRSKAGGNRALASNCSGSRNQLGGCGNESYTMKVAFENTQTSPDVSLR